MTPFDPIALLSMLLTFYQPATVDNLRRAHRERPDYFAGGHLVSTGGEKLLLSDGRIFDLIFDVGGPRARYQVTDVTAGGGAGGAFPLEPGPLTPIAVDSVLPPPSSGDSFESRLASTLGELAAADGAIGVHEGIIAGAADPIGFDVEFEDTIGRAAATLDGDRFALAALDPGALLDRSREQEFGIDGVDRELPNPDDGPPDMDPPDLGDPPRGERPPPDREK
jgi:hypothetical protein